jgi:membrane-associated phospholipid phosphatase
MIRRVTLVSVALALLACSDRPTAPNEVRSSVTRAAASVQPEVSAQSVSSVPASANWQATAGGLVAGHSLSPIVAARAYGLVSIAQYGAAVFAGPGADAEDENDGGGANASPRAHYYEMRGAVAGASAQVLKYVFPAAVDVASIESQVAREGSVGTPGTRAQFARGVELGRAIGDIVVQRGRGDGFANADGTPKVWDFSTLPIGPTFWRMDLDATPHVPSGFQFPTMRPYYLTSTSQFRPPPPPADLSSAVAEVIAVVNARTPEQAATSVRWNLSNGSVTALGYWIQLATKYVAQYGFDEREAAHVFALETSAGLDATLGCWDAKYHYLTLRPWMVAPTDLPNTKLNLGRPNHPSYPSGHSCVSSAAGTVLKNFFPGESMSIDAQVAEAGMSRIYAGIHYFTDVEQGQRLGASVARWAIAFDREQGLLSAVFRN